MDDNGVWQEEKTTGSLACEVTSVGVREEGGWNSTLTCNATPKLPSAFPQRFVATSKGLSQRYDSGEISGTLIDQPPRVLSSHDVQVENEGSMGWIVTNQGSRWCFGRSETNSGFQHDWLICVRDGDFVGGKSFGRTDASVMIRWGDAED